MVVDLGLLGGPRFWALVAHAKVWPAISFNIASFLSHLVEHRSLGGFKNESSRVRDGHSRPASFTGLSDSWPVTVTLCVGSTRRTQRRS